MIFSIKPQIFELKCVFSYFRLKTHITLLLPVYVHSWEQRKLSDIAVLTSSKRVHAEDYVETGVPFYRGKEISELKEHKPISEVLYITEYKYNEISSMYGSPKEGDLLITAVGTLGNTWVIDQTPFYFKDGNLIWFKDIKCNPKYLDYAMSTADGQKKILASAIGSNQKALTMVKLNELEFMFPGKAEQDKIAEYFSYLDNLITLHQCKCQIDGCRFQSPLAITWEQRKVTEIGKIYIGLVTTMTKHYTDEGTLLIRNSDIKDGKFEFGDNPIYLEKTFAEKNETRMHQIGDVITVHTGDVGTSAVITENEAKSIGFATIVTRPNPKIIDSNYLCSFLNTDKHKKWAVSISTGDGRTNYNLGDYFELVVPVPSIAEQKKIASYIQKLNRLITLHQCE